MLAEGVAKTRLEAFNNVMKAHPNINIVATEDAYWDTAKSETIAGQLFARFAPQGGLDAVVGWADNQTAAIIRAAEAAHIPLGTGKGQLIVIGTNCTRDGIQAIKEGKEYSSGTQAPVASGQQTAELVASYFEGKPLPKHVVLDVHTVDKGQRRPVGGLPAPINRRSVSDACSLSVNLRRASAPSRLFAGCPCHSWAAKSAASAARTEQARAR